VSDIPYSILLLLEISMRCRQTVLSSDGEIVHKVGNIGRARIESLRGHIISLGYHAVTKGTQFNALSNEFQYLVLRVYDRLCSRYTIASVLPCMQSRINAPVPGFITLGHSEGTWNPHDGKPEFDHTHTYAPPASASDSLWSANGYKLLPRISESVVYSHHTGGAWI